MASLIENPDKDVHLRYTLQRKFLGYGLEANTMLRAGLHRLRDNTVPEKRFLIFGRGRSGSTLLTSLLDSHTEITCLGEILRYKAMSPRRQLDHALSVAKTKVSGCKFLSYQMRSIHGMGTESDFLKSLHDEGVTIIYLKRTNLVRHAVSNLYARKRQAYHSSDKRAAQVKKITIKPDEIFAWMEGSAALNDYEAAVLANTPHLALTYEDNLSAQTDQFDTYKTLLDTFELPFEEPETKLKKVTPKQFDALIENHEELVGALEQSKYAEFLVS